MAENGAVAESDDDEPGSTAAGPSESRACGTSRAVE
jgi:hypothetical protein